MRRFDLALFLELNEAYRAKPLVPAPRSYDPEALASRGMARAQKLVHEFNLKGKSVLELGCGHGEVARALATEHGCRVVAIDIEPHAEWAEADGVDFLVADLTDGAPSELGQFDFIFASSVWEHVRHPYTMLKEAKKLLAPQGVFHLSANLYRGPKASHRYREVFFPWPHLLFEDDVFEDFYRHIGMEPDRPAWINHLTAAEYQRYFELLGFSVQRLWYSITPLDQEFYQRFEERLSRYPIFDLERDFIHVILTHGHALGHPAGATSGPACFPPTRRARPLMVVGGPRCGTRFVASALNRHPDILIQGEIPRRAMDSAVRFLSEASEFFASVPQWSDSWEQSRRDLIYSIWASMSKSTPRVASDTIAWFGHKTPRHDRYWEFYRRFFADIRPKYIFCMRNFIDHYLSMNSMKEIHRIDRVAREFRLSITRYAEMKMTLGDDVSLFLLDDLTDGGIDYVRETLFERLGIEVDRETLAQIDVSRPANSTEGAGRSRRRELTPEERTFLERNSDLLAGLEALRAARPLTPALDSTADPPRANKGFTWRWR